MSDLATAPADRNAGVAALARLTERIATLVPPQPAAPLLLQPSQEVAAGLARARVLSAQAAQRAARRAPRSMIGTAVESFVAACSFVPYALVALGLRLLMARIFFLDGQSKIGGPRIPVDFYGFDFSVILPTQIKAETFTAFMTQFAPLPVPPLLAATMVSYAEFILPIMLLIGFGTRIAAFGMLIMTAVIQVYVMPEALWTTQIYWFAILAVLLSQGPGHISLDRFIHFITRR
jgi:putative oxidoreductase